MIGLATLEALAWKDMPTNRMLTRLREVADSSAADSEVFVTLLPMSPALNALPDIVETSKAIVSTDTTCCLLNFQDVEFGAWYRGFESFSLDGNLEISLPHESRLFKGCILCIMSPRADNLASQIVSHARFAAHLRLTSWDVVFSAIGCQFMLDTDANLQPSLGFETTIQNIDINSTGTALRNASSDIPADVPMFLEAAARAGNKIEKFIFTWTALEYLMGGPKARKLWFAEIDSPSILERFERIRRTRSSVFKNTHDFPLQPNDAIFLIEAMKLFRITDKGFRKEMMRILENKLSDGRV